MFSFFKMLLWLCSPLTVLLAIGIACAGVLFVKRHWRWGIVVSLIMAWVGIMSLPIMAYWLGHGLESQYPPQSILKYPQADVIVVLGGGCGSQVPPLWFPNLNAAGDRIIQAVRLFKHGKAPFVLPTGTDTENSDTIVLRALGIPDAAIISESKSRDTAENVEFSLKILQEKKCRSMLLVTSAWHMPRAMMLFKQTGLHVVPAPADYESMTYNAQARPLWQELPSAEALYKSSVYFKEYLGIAFYSLKKPKVPTQAKQAEAKDTKE